MMHSLAILSKLVKSLIIVTYLIAELPEQHSILFLNIKPCSIDSSKKLIGFIQYAHMLRPPLRHGARELAIQLTMAC